MGEEGAEKGVDIELIYYLNNNEKSKGKLNFTHLNDENNKISYNDITFSFYLMLKERQENEKENLDIKNLDIRQNNINYESIRYYDAHGWVSLKETEVIFLDDELTKDILKIMIYAKVSSETKMNIKNKYNKIDKEIELIYNQLTEEINNNLVQNDPLNLVVLTANPLMNGEKELRTINDFNIIKSKIYKVFNEEEEEDYLKYIEFYPLTINTLKDVLLHEYKRPVILHLICKSTYIIPNGKKPEKDSDNYINLIFEKDNNYCNLEFIDKAKLQEIYNELDEELKENIKKIILIISTPFVEDVYNLFKDFGFKNIFVQQTTLANIDYVAEFNYAFYQEIKEAKSVLPINDIYKFALQSDLLKNIKPIFCCCFHKHEKNCYFLNNKANPENPEFNYYELYNDNGNYESIENIKKIIPHFYHLFPDCPDDRKKNNVFYKLELDSLILLENQLPINSFCFYKKTDSDSFKYLVEDKTKKGNAYSLDNIINNFYNLCCCQNNFHEHNINFAFKKDFNDNDKNNKIRFKSAKLTEITNEKKFIPNYETMILFVGKNKIIYEALEFVSSNSCLTSPRMLSVTV